MLTVITKLDNKTIYNITYYSGDVTVRWLMTELFIEIIILHKENKLKMSVATVQ